MKKQLAEINMDTQVKQFGGLDTSDIDGEKVMMDLENGYYFMLNNVATRIWDIAEEDKSIGEIIEVLLGEYDIDRATCEKQVIQFVTHLNARQLVSIH